VSAVALSLVWSSGDVAGAVPCPVVVDPVSAAALIQAWSAVQTEALVVSIRRSGALQRYVRGARK
jgi:hypothetical protein